MLEKCVRDQWSIDDLDWSLPPPQLPRAKEEAVVQYFTDMAGIELLAGALFDVQRQKTDDPTLKKIFATFSTASPCRCRTKQNEKRFAKNYAESLA